MTAVRRFAATAALLFVLSHAAQAEEGFFSKLNPFSSSKPTSSSQNKPFPGFSNHRSKKKPEKTLIGKTVDSVTSTTRTAWNKTTSALSPKNLLPGSGSKAPPKKSSTKKGSSSWSLTSSDKEERSKEVGTVSDWLSLPRP
jgi:hypothetical protein